MTHKTVSFVFNEGCVHTETGVFTISEQHTLWVDGKIVYNGKLYQGLFSEPTSPRSFFDLRAVMTGVDLHWQRQEDQRLKGALNLMTTDKDIVMINQVDVEEYLTSVTSPEMSVNAFRELLETHAVISQSWLLIQIEKGFNLNGSVTPYKSCYRDNETLIRWYGRKDHDLFDVYAGDHCQRHQSITRASNPIVREVIKEAHGEVLMDNDAICNTRFSKYCGGVTEKFRDYQRLIPYSYLTALRDDEVPFYPDLTDEREAEQWIRISPEAPRNTTDKGILSQALNNYSQEITDFYHWKIEYTQEELSSLIHWKTGMDFRPIIDLIPLERGSPGHITKLKIVGVRRPFTIGKGLEIRRTLSKTHLYSPAFVVDKKDIRLDIPPRFILIEAGWRYDVGLCQIGVTVMETKGYSYQKIPTRYFPGASIEERY